MDSSCSARSQNPRRLVHHHYMRRALPTTFYRVLLRDALCLSLKAHNIVMLEGDRDRAETALRGLPRRRRPALKPERRKSCSCSLRCFLAPRPRHSPCMLLRAGEVYVEVICQGSNFGDAYGRRAAPGGGFRATCEACG